MVISYFPGRGTLFEETYLEGQAEGMAEGIAKGIATGKAQGVAEGRAVGRAEAVLRVLQARGFTVSDAVRDRLFDCSDLSRLDDWLVRAVKVEQAEDLFGED
ncbi:MULTISPECIES: hypothetical protein [unclassified Streptomyces]|uniref:hypothetical protein n=1 Tax=unclassified Streptomyces TaxID=2593676 RepID=UPI00093C0651